MVFTEADRMVRLKERLIYWLKEEKYLFSVLHQIIYLKWEEVLL